MKRVVIKWGRVGQRHMSDGAEDMFVTDLINVEALQARIEAMAGKYVNGPYEVKLHIRVQLDGGKYRNMPFGYGVVEQLDVESD